MHQLKQQRQNSDYLEVNHHNNLIASGFYSTLSVPISLFGVNDVHHTEKPWLAYLFLPATCGRIFIPFAYTLRTAGINPPYR